MQSTLPRDFAFLPQGQRTVDTQYRDMLTTILEKGNSVKTALDWPAKGDQPARQAHAWKILGHTLRYDLRNGIPMITERNLDGDLMGQGIGEILAFLNGASTQEEFAEFGCFWWRKWLTPAKCEKRGLAPGESGPGSYGPAWTAFPHPGHEPFNQIKALIGQVKDRPELRTHLVTPYIPPYLTRAPGYQQKVVVVPCHGFFFIDMYQDDDGVWVMSMHHIQRSADAPVGLEYNLVQYPILLLLLAKECDCRVGEYVHTVNDVHIYDGQRDKVEELLSRPAHPFPILEIVNDKPSIFDYRKEDFVFHEYVSGDRMIIPTPV